MYSISDMNNHDCNQVATKPSGENFVMVVHPRGFFYGLKGI